MEMRETLKRAAGTFDKDATAPPAPEHPFEEKTKRLGRFVLSVPHVPEHLFGGGANECITKGRESFSFFRK